MLAVKKDGKFNIGAPYVEGAVVKAEIVEDLKVSPPFLFNPPPPLHPPYPPPPPILLGSDLVWKGPWMQELPRMYTPPPGCLSLSLNGLGET